MKSELQQQRAEITGRKSRTEFWDQRRADKIEREKLIQELLSEGKTDQQIADIIGVSTKTVTRRRNAS